MKRKSLIHKGPFDRQAFIQIIKDGSELTGLEMMTGIYGLEQMVQAKGVEVPETTSEEQFTIANAKTLIALLESAPKASASPTMKQNSDLDSFIQRFKDNKLEDQVEYDEIISGLTQRLKEQGLQIPQVRDSEGFTDYNEVIENLIAALEGGSPSAPKTEENPSNQKLTSTQKILQLYPVKRGDELAEKRQKERLDQHAAKIKLRNAPASASGNVTQQCIEARKAAGL